MQTQCGNNANSVINLLMSTKRTRLYMVGKKKTSGILERSV